MYSCSWWRRLVCFTVHSWYLPWHRVDTRHMHGRWWLFPLPDAALPDSAPGEGWGFLLTLTVADRLWSTHAFSRFTVPTKFIQLTKAKAISFYDIYHCRNNSRTKINPKNILPGHSGTRGMWFLVFWKRIFLNQSSIVNLQRPYFNPVPSTMIHLLFIQWEYCDVWRMRMIMRGCG